VGDSADYPHAVLLVFCFIDSFIKVKDSHEEGKGAAAGAKMVKRIRGLGVCQGDRT
jgi:hypothetical protein